MNRQTLSVFIVVIGVAGGVVYLLMNRTPSSIAPVAPTPTPQANQVPSSTVSIRVPVDVFGDEVPIRGKSFVNTSTGAMVSFSKKIDLSDGSANGNVEVSI